MNAVTNRRTRRAPAFDIPIKTFPVTVPLLGAEAAAFFRPLPEERLSKERRIHDLFSVQYSLDDLEEVKEALEDPHLPGPEWYRLLALGEEIAASARYPGELLAPAHLAERWRRYGVIPYAHQLETARRVIYEMGCRAILADEVGLGKTIEAGLILKECCLRGMVRRVLILTPASLCRQWYYELKEKFNLACGLQRSEYDWERTNILIASMDTAKRPPHCDIIHSLSYDMLIVDEAHKLKNAGTHNYAFVNAIRRKYCLMLTATPVQNDLKELYNLINIIRPGQLGTYRQFKAEFMHDLRTPKQTENLKALLHQVMVRNRRGEESVQFTERDVHSIPIDLSPPERELYDRVSRFVREEYHRLAGTPANLLPLITLQREVCSSAVAAAVTLEKLLKRTEDAGARATLQELLDLALSIEQSSKVDFLENLLARTDEKVIVFTEYRATQEFVRWRLQRAGVSTLGFNGSLSSSRKGWIRELFRTQARVLVSTESGGEGLNFQFCNHVVNYDLPWNPMRLEQRIGRVHRLGQTRDVHIFNLATRDSVEEHILYLLYEKINMFQMILGELDAILSRARMKGSFEAELAEILLGSRSPEEIRRKLDALAHTILEAKNDANTPEGIDKLLTW